MKVIQVFNKVIEYLNADLFQKSEINFSVLHFSWYALHILIQFGHGFIHVPL